MRVGPVVCAAVTIAGVSLVPPAAVASAPETVVLVLTHPTSSPALAAAVRTRATSAAAMLGLNVAASSPWTVTVIAPASTMATLFGGGSTVLPELPPSLAGSVVAAIGPGGPQFHPLQVSPLRGCRNCPSGGGRGHGGSGSSGSGHGGSGSSGSGHGGSGSSGSGHGGMPGGGRGHYSARHSHLAHHHSRAASTRAARHHTSRSVSGRSVPRAAASPPPAALRSAYLEPAASTSAPALTVATLQFAGWNPADLTAYASASGLPDPVASGRYTSVPVLGAATSGSSQAAVEVALDQESLYGLAPTAAQRAYFAPNSLQGFVQSIYQVASDAPKYHIAALSISWGACELGWGSASSQMEAALSAASAAGVSVFAATGDNGVDDCGMGMRAVDYPASSPHVIAVGGTSLSLAGSATAPTVGSETAWSGGGGGISTLFARPSYQVGDGQTSTMRTIPDIASDADPATGATIYSSAAGGWLQVGGTSMAAPTQAALLVGAEQADHLTVGVGDLHAALYGAPASAFRDVTSGSNGADGVPGYSAGVGYDLVSGRGAPLWQKLLTPTATTTLALTSTATSTTATPTPSLVETWTGKDLVGGAQSYAVTTTVALGATRTTTTTLTSASTLTLTPVAGATYTVSVVATDAAGASSSPATATVTIPVDNRALTVTGAWTIQTGANYYLGSVSSASAAGATATAQLPGKALSVIFATGPTAGQAQVSVDGGSPTTVSLYSANAGTLTAPLTTATDAVHTVKITVLGTKGTGSSGTLVAIDDLIGVS